MDANLLDAVAGGSTRRIVYVADACCYGPTGCRSITEDEPSRPSAWRRGLTPALDRLDGYIAAGLPIVTAFPGWVYGNGSWFRERVMKPVLAGGRVLQFGKTGPLVSPIHVHDCARALVHLAQRGEAGGGYFLVNDDPVRLNEFATRFAALANRRLRTWRIPSAATRLVVGPILADYVQADAVLSNIRLRGIGFRFNTRLSNRDSSKSSEQSMNSAVCPPASAPRLEARFEEPVLPYLGDAYRLARWLLRNEHDAEDVVQEASLRAFRYFRTFTGGNGRAWFLRIVRNTCSGWRGRASASTDPFDEQQHSPSQPSTDPEMLLLQTDHVVLIEQAMSRLPARYKELLALRELEGLSYQELAARLDIPMGTVMSSLSRARQALRAALDDQLKQYNAIARSTYETSERRI